MWGGVGQREYRCARAYIKLEHTENGTMGTAHTHTHTHAWPTRNQINQSQVSGWQSIINTWCDSVGIIWCNWFQSRSDLSLSLSYRTVVVLSSKATVLTKELLAAIFFFSFRGPHSLKGMKTSCGRKDSAWHNQGAFSPTYLVWQSKMIMG